MKRTLLLVPGLLCDEAVWAPQVTALSDVVDPRVIPNGPRDSLGILAASIIAQAPPRFVLAGHSMGGRIALEVARRVPDRLLGIALFDTGFEPLAPGSAGKRETDGRYSLLELARRDGMRAMAREWIKGMIYPRRLTDSALVNSILDMFERKSPEYFAMQIRALLGRPDAGPVLSSLQCPTLFLCGREDVWSPPSRHEEMARMARHSTLEVIPECGHMSPVERPEAVSAALRRWLAQIETPT